MGYWVFQAWEVSLVERKRGTARPTLAWPIALLIAAGATSGMTAAR
jgi:hypothetical protein